MRACVPGLMGASVGESGVCALVGGWEAGAWVCTCGRVYVCTGGFIRDVGVYFIAHE